jgi:hypothetical protein
MGGAHMQINIQPPANMEERRTLLLHFILGVDILLKSIRWGGDVYGLIDKR